MKRRKFIRSTSAAFALPFLLNAFHSCTAQSSRHRVFVFIQLEGGNDGLNTLIPLNNYGVLAAARPNLLIPEKKTLSLKGVTDTALHPSLSEIKELYDNGLIAFVQGVGYDNPSYSHFRSSDIWLTGSDASTVLYTGWAARYLESHYQNYPNGFPNVQHPDPLAIKIGDTGTYLFQGEEMDMGIVLDSAGMEPGDIKSPASEQPTLAGKEISSIRRLLLQTQRYSGVVNNALKSSFTHSKLYPPQGENSLADKLKTVAQLIGSGLQTSVYLVDLTGFDTHNSQVDPSDPTKGEHANLLHKLSQAIACFWDDVIKMGKENEVAGMTFSEFGRRIMSNASYGTDHGSSQPLLFFGANIKPGITGTNPVLPQKVTVNDNLALQYDFRSVYASVLKSWFEAPENSISEILYGDFPPLQLFRENKRLSFS